VKRSAPVLKQISALLALLVAAFVTAPAGASAPPPAALRACSDIFSDVAALPGEQLLARASAEDEKGSPGGGDAPLLAAAPELSGPSPDQSYAGATTRAHRPTASASYQARAPPAA
jgi:hypothetical protein